MTPPACHRYPYIRMVGFDLLVAFDTHIVQNHLIGSNPFCFRDIAVALILNGLAAMAIYAALFNRFITRFQLMVAISARNFVFHGMLGMIEYCRMLVVLIPCGKRILKDMRNLRFGEADPANQE